MKFFPRLWIVILAALTASVAGAQYGPTPAELDANFERVLLPVYVRNFALGAFGKTWRTPFWVYNDSDSPAEFIPNVFCFQPLPLRSTIPPRVPTSPDLVGEPIHSANEIDQPVPWLVFIEKSRSADVTLALQIVGPAGTNQMPVVREREFRFGSVQLLNVPPLRNSRLTIRTYDPDIVANASVSIRITTMFRSVPLLSTERTLQGGGRQGCFSYVPAHPNFDVFTLSQEDMAANPFGESLRIEIIGEGDVRRLTAMATTTDNATGCRNDHNTFLGRRHDLRTALHWNPGGTRDQHCSRSGPLPIR